MNHGIIVIPREIRTWNFEEEERSRAIHTSHTRGALPMKYKTQKLDFELTNESPETASSSSTSFVTLLNGQCHLQQFQKLFSTSMETLFSDFTLSLPFKAQITGLSLFVSFPFLFLVPFNSITDCLCFTEIKSYEPG